MQYPDEIPGSQPLVIALRFKSFSGSVYLLLLLPLLPVKPHSFLFLAEAAGNLAREDKMCNEHDTSEQSYYLQRSAELSKRKPHLRQQHNRCKSYGNKPTFPPLVNGHTNYFSITGNGFYENGHENNEVIDGIEEDENSSHTSRVLIDSVAHADYSFDKGNGDSDDAVGESNGSESKDGYYVLNGDSSKDAECQIGGANELGDRHGHDVDGNDGANVGNDNADHDDANDGGNAGFTVENDDDSDEDGDNGYRRCDNHHHPHHHCARDEHSDGGGGDGNKDSSGDRADVKDDSIHGKFIRDSNFDNEDKNDAAATDDDYPVTKSSSLPVDSIAPGKSIKDIKLVTKETHFSLSVNTGLDDQVKSWTIGITAGDNNGNKKPPGARAKTVLTSNEYTAKVPTTRYPPNLRPKTSSLRLPRVNGTELNYFYNSRIPSLDATGIDQDFLARHTTDQSLQHASQPSDFKQTRELTPPRDWPVWSLPPPPMSETNDLRHRWPQSSVLHPSVVSYQTGGQSDWNDEPRALRLPTVKSPKATATVTELQPSASVTSWSVPSYTYQSSVLPENGQERFLEPSTPNSFTENREHVHPVTSSELSPLRREDQGNGALALSPEFPDDPSLAALERKVAEACAVVERVMKEREERTKAQREAARKKREMREQREREAREMKEREERERRERKEREEREEREREDRKMRERQEREIRERNERDRSEQIENEDRDTRWIGGERAPVQESPRWQCQHYQRRCLVQFPCCGIFYPCHRCHNTSGACDTDDRKANNATHVKCGICGHEEEVSGFVLTVIPTNCFAHSCCA